MPPIPACACTSMCGSRDDAAATHVYGESERGREGRMPYFKFVEPTDNGVALGGVWGTEKSRLWLEATALLEIWRPPVATLTSIRKHLLIQFCVRSWRTAAETVPIQRIVFVMCTTIGQYHQKFAYCKGAGVAQILHDLCHS